MILKYYKNRILRLKMKKIDRQLSLIHVLLYPFNSSVIIYNLSCLLILFSVTFFFFSFGSQDLLIFLYGLYAVILFILIALNMAITKHLLVGKLGVASNLPFKNISSLGLFPYKKLTLINYLVFCVFFIVICFPSYNLAKVFILGSLGDPYLIFISLAFILIADSFILGIFLISVLKERSLNPVEWIKRFKINYGWASYLKFINFVSYCIFIIPLIAWLLVELEVQIYR